MDNKLIYKIAGKVCGDLKRDGYITNAVKPKQTVYNALRLELDSFADVKSPQIALTDDDIRSQLRTHLLARLADGTLTAAEIGQLKDIFGLTDKDKDVYVQLVDYTNAVTECSSCGNALQ